MKLIWGSILACTTVSAQVQLSQIGTLQQQDHACLSQTERTQLIEETHRIKSVYQSAFNKRSTTSFIWPLQASEDYPDNDYFTISNYVDHQPAISEVQDYNCGERTYDLNNGYNHQGTDIFMWPYGWNIMDNDYVQVIAAADGIISQKYDGNADQNCDFSNPDWNAIQIIHADGTSSWYGHLKKNSLTDKSVGESVTAGEVIGLVGSSGYSTGPHLHFEVWNSNDEVIDPFEGTCNNGSTLWNNQKNYHDPRLLKVSTHHADPEINDCYGETNPNFRNYFAPGQTLYMVAYYRDLSTVETSQFTLIKPDGSTYYTWEYNIPEGYYSASYLSWNLPLSSNAEFGVWTFQVEFEGETLSQQFEVVDSPASIEEHQDIHYQIIGQNIEFSQNVNQVQVYDINGRLMQQSSTPTSNLTIQPLNGGLYFLNYQTNFGNFTKLIQIP